MENKKYYSDFLQDLRSSTLNIKGRPIPPSENSSAD